jgi:hypothetical protein
MAPALEPVAPQAPEPEVIELRPVTPAAEPQQDIAATAAAPPPAEPELPAMTPEPAPPAPATAEPEIAPLAQDSVEAPEQPLAPPPPAEPALPEIQVLAPPAPVEEPQVDLPVAESLAPPAAEAAFELPVNGSQAGAFRVVVRLTDGDGVEVGEFRDFGTAMQGAQEVIDQVSHSNGSWPFFAGRFIRPDLIVSVDVVDAAS